MGYIDGIHVTIYGSTMDPMGIAIQQLYIFVGAASPGLRGLSEVSRAAVKDDLDDPTMP